MLNRVAGALMICGDESSFGSGLHGVAYIPVARALELFNRDSLMEINLSYAEGANAQRIVDAAKAILVARHGREDFTLVTQEDMLRTLSNILDILTIAVAALGSISLLVGGVGIVTIMTIAVAERTSEIGLLVALGARRSTVLGLFLGEAAVPSAVGGVLGLAQAVRLVVPALPVHTPLAFVALAEVLAAGIGLIAGVLPARRASRLDPVQALREE